MKQTQYMDQEGNLYFVRPGIGGSTFKGFRRSSCPQKGQRRESGIRSLAYVAEWEQAQRDLDAYAAKHQLTPVTEKEVL